LERFYKIRIGFVIKRKKKGFFWDICWGEIGRETPFFEKLDLWPYGIGFTLRAMF
jgi:hypothetical protein